MGFGGADWRHRLERRARRCRVVATRGWSGTRLRLRGDAAGRADRDRRTFGRRCRTNPRLRRSLHRGGDFKGSELEGARTARLLARLVAVLARFLLARLTDQAGLV